MLCISFRWKPFVLSFISKLSWSIRHFSCACIDVSMLHQFQIVICNNDSRCDNNIIGIFGVNLWSWFIVYSSVLTVEIKYCDLFIYLKFLPIVCVAPEVQDPGKQKRKRALGPVLLIGHVFVYSFPR